MEYTCASDPPVSNKSVSGTQYSPDRPYCPVIFNVSNGLVEYLDEKLAKIRDADLDHLLVAVSERLECSAEDFKGASDRLLWFKSGIHVYDVVELAENHAIQP